uniref:Glycosyltransferase n=1 Tax=viral metagenome TaxID=1070528 RepID=A0A6M3ISG5_9ZZZZ
MNHFLHNGAAGDIIYSLPAIIALGGGALYTKPKFHKLLERLLDLQPYIKDFRIFADFPIRRSVKNFPLRFESEGRELINLDLYRNGEQAWSARGLARHLAQHHLDLFPELGFDLFQPWLQGVEPKRVASIVVNRSRRYHDREEIDWSLLEPYKEQWAFIGKSNDYRDMRQIVGYAPRQFVCSDALEMAQVIKGSRLFIGNQSLGFALAEAMKHPARVLEVCYGKDNCRPYGAEGHIALTDRLIERSLCNT